MHDTDHKYIVEFVPDSVKMERYSVDGWEFEPEEMEVVHDGHELDEISETLEQGTKKPERKRKVKEAPALKARKKYTQQKKCVNETFQ